jgi:hypothetical protein
MRRTWATAAVCGAVLAAGCPESGPPKREIAQPVDGSRGDAPPVKPASTAKPAKTDPAAETVIEKLLGTHTGGKPELLDKLKTFKSVRKGRFEEVGAAEWTVEAVWPDRFRQQTEIPQLGGGLNVTVRNGPTGWKLLRSQRMTEPVPLTALEMNAFQTDIFGEWMALLVPLLDKSARVAAPVAAAEFGGKPTTGVRIWIGDHPPVVLRVDDASGRLMRIEYSISSDVGVVPIVIAFGEQKETNGVVLPVKSAYTANNRPATTWDSAEYEFPKQIPDDAFVKP